MWRYAAATMAVSRGIMMKLRKIYLPLIVAVWIATCRRCRSMALPRTGKKFSTAQKKKDGWFYTPAWKPTSRVCSPKSSPRRYPFIKPEIFRSSGEKVQARFLVEHRANTHLADIFQTSIVQVYQLKNSGLLARYVSEEAPAYARWLQRCAGPLDCVLSNPVRDRLQHAHGRGQGCRRRATKIC